MWNIKWIYYTYLFSVSQVRIALSGNTLGIPWLHITSVYLTETNSNYPIQTEIKNKASLGFQFSFFLCKHLSQPIKKGPYPKSVMYYHYLAQTKTLKVSFPILGCTAGQLDSTKEMKSTSQTEANARNCGWRKEYINKFVLWITSFVCPSLSKLCH